eukprot:749182-Hanusia_phi.AAC.2
MLAGDRVLTIDKEELIPFMKTSNLARLVLGPPYSTVRPLSHTPAFSRLYAPPSLPSSSLPSPIWRNRQQRLSKHGALVAEKVGNKRRRAGGRECGGGGKEEREQAGRYERETEQEQEEGDMGRQG